MWINGYNADQFASLSFENGGGGSTALVGNLLSSYLYAGPASPTLSTYAAVADARTAVTNFVAAAGFPWITIGDVSTAVAGQLVAINFKNLLKFSDGTTGLYIGGDISNGYSPWANYSDARVAILKLLGNLSV